MYTLINGLNIKVIIVSTDRAGLILSFFIIVFSIAIDIIRFIPLSILVSFCNRCV